jgi:cell division septal protein FtsQ
VRDKIAPQVGQKLARVDVRSIENSLVDLDWVKSSSASRDWLSKKIQITVFERVPVARALTAQNKLVNFDSEGVIFTPVSTEQGKNQSSLPLVSAAIASNENLAIVATLMRKLPKDLDYLVTKLDQISVTKAGFILMSTQINGKAVRINWGSIDQIEQKFQVLKALLELPENGSISQVDLSEPNAPIVK